MSAAEMWQITAYVALALSLWLNFAFFVLLCLIARKPECEHCAGPEPKEDR